MEKKYISENRYQKSSVRKRRNSSTVKTNLKKGNVKNSTYGNSVSSFKQVKPKKKKLKKKNKQSNKKNIIICIILLVLIAIISRAILKDDDEPFIYFSFASDENTQEINVGVITNEDFLSKNINNIVVCELNKHSKPMLLTFDEKYNITYGLLSSVNKISNSEYELIINEKYDVTKENIKKQIEEYINNTKSMYYTKVSNIKNIDVSGKNIKIDLYKEDPYYTYKLDIPIEYSGNYITDYVLDSASSSNRLVYIRNKKADEKLPLRISLTKYKDMYDEVDAYKKGTINMFLTNAENTENILGKYDYNISTYRNGTSVFLTFNPKSKIIAKDEVRKAIAYGINKDSIIKDVLKGKGSSIDLPYIYDEPSFKYDVYASENLLLTNGYKKINKVYSKDEDGVKTSLSLNLLVNKSDKTKIEIAKRIKNNLASIGIVVNINKLTETKIKNKVLKGDYDLVLTSVNLNENPDISFISDRLYLNDIIKEDLDKVNASDIKGLPNNINELKLVLSEQIGIIGIYSDVSYIVYSKDIIGIENPTYLNIFKRVLSNN